MMVRRVAPAALLALAIGASLLPSGASVLPDECSEIRFVGPACRRPNGLLELTLDDGTRLLTHGADPIATHRGNDLFEVKKRNPSCVKDTDTQPHVQLLYTHGVDRASRYPKMLYKIRRMAKIINGLLYEEAREFNRTARYRMACSKGEPSVIHRQLPLTRETGDFFNVVTEVRRAGFVDPLAKYWIFYDEFYGGLGGVATLLPDDRLVAENRSNFGPSYGVFYGYTNNFGIEALMHEGAHNLGAVQNSAPNTSGAGHCIDDLDIMCYPDGGPRASRFRTNVCARVHFDCGHDDYFHPKPGKRNYLRRNWNLGSPLNKYFAGCSYRIGQLLVGTAGVDPDKQIEQTLDDWDPVAARSYTIPKRCRGHGFALQGFVSSQGLPVDPYVPDLSLFGVPPRDAIISQVAAPDFNVCFFAGKRALRCYDDVGTDRGRVPKSATKARIMFNGGITGTYIFNVM